MRSTRTGRVVAVLVVAALAALALTHGSSASWRTLVGLGGTTLTSGTLTLRVGSATSQSSAWRFSALDGSVLGPGSTVQAPLTVVNTGTTAGAVSLASTAVTGRAGPLQLSVVRVATAAACPATGTATGTVLYGPGPLVGATTTARPLAAGARETWCFRVAVTSNDVADSGATAGVTFTLRLDQARRP